MEINDRVKIEACGYAAAIWKLYPLAEFHMSENDITTLCWGENNTVNFDLDLIIETQKQLEIEYENNQYQRDRAVSYPTIQDQLDLLYHGGLDAWKAEINKVKEQYPKPEGL